MNTIAHYIIKQLQKENVDYTFGIPGDFVLPLYKIQDECGMKTVICSHEPNAAFAADAYARIKGIGVVLTTFGPGGLNMVNPIAMAYAEHSPVLIISGAPEFNSRIQGYKQHHHVKTYDTQLNVFNEVTTAAVRLENPENAVEQIESVLKAMFKNKRPGYIEIPRDILQSEVIIPNDFKSLYRNETKINQDALNEASSEIEEILKQSKTPVLYAGVGVRRNELSKTLTELSEKWKIPVVNSVLGKASFPETHPHYQGVFMGDMGDSSAKETIDKADCVISIGVIHSDVNTGFRTGLIDSKKHIIIDEHETVVHYHKYEQLPMRDVVKAINEKTAQEHAPVIKTYKKTADNSENTSDKLSIQQVIDTLQSLDSSKYAIIADVGESWFVGIEITSDMFIAPGYYASMGFAIPAGLGVAMADKNIRPLIIVGDGAFQMTGGELATLKSQGLNPIVLVLNNVGYNMLRAIDGDKDYFNIPHWNYSQISSAMGCESAKVYSCDEFNNTLNEAEASSQPFLIEVMLEAGDHAPIMSKFQDFVVAKKTLSTNG